MDVHQLPSLDAYVTRLREDSGEVTSLFHDLLIGVTGFFRDPDAFEALAREVIPRIFERLGAGETVRIWVPACSTGEEVYSIVILLREHLDTLKAAPAIQVFATDIDETALAISRMGRYPAQLLEGVSPERLRRFFVRDGATCTVAKELRDNCVFSLHSVIRDPPFSRLDLISCRNLLIYLGPEFQSRVFPIFHFALKPQGFLFLGNSESIGNHAELFAPVDKKQRVFQRREHAVSPLQLAPFGGPVTPGRGIAELQRDFGPAATTLRRTVEARLTERFAPAHVVVNRDGDIVHYSTRTGKYLEPPAGAPNRQLITMARKGLRLELRAALHEAVETQRTAERKNIAIEIDDRTQVIDLVIDPIVDPKNEPLFLVLFRDVGIPAAPSNTDGRAGGEGDARFEQIEQELRDVRERLQATIEEYETGVEELKSSNEELQTVNEELQSSNEELETAKEELQSLNEEMHTVNSELTVKIEELDRANSDLRNIFASTQIAVIFLDANLVIRTFTPAATEIFNLISTDRGRPLSDIASKLADGDLHRDIRRVFERGEIIERNVRTSEGSTQYLMRILPYRTKKDVIEGILVTFVDVTVIAKSGH
jgi:two-component system CheB/CheR fusion protein